MASVLAKNIEDALRNALPPQDTYVLHEPLFEGNEQEYVKSCIDEGWVSSAGAFVDRFERDLAKQSEVGYAVACVNGTSALHIALMLAGVRANDEVLLPALTFIATANSISYCNAHPVFIDSSSKDLGVDVEKLREFLRSDTVIREGQCINNSTGRVIRAIVPVHVFGHPCRMDELQSVCEEYSISIVEDVAEALGTKFLGRPLGGWGAASALSFNGNKIITTGGGGAILTDDPEIARHAKHLTTTAKVPHAWQYHHDEIGYNYRMPNINAALGCAQLEKLNDMIASKRTLALRYTDSFKEIEGVHFFEEPADTLSNYWLNAILLEPKFAEQRDSILEHLVTNGIHARPVWELLCDLPMYSSCQTTDVTVAKDLASRIINIPSSAGLAR